MKKLGKIFVIFLLEFVTLVLLYVGLLTIANVSTSNKAKQNLVDAMWIIGEEGEYPVIWDDQAIRLDNYTDLIMVQKSILSDKKALVSALHMGGYPRYWHGYVVVLKPLFSILSLFQIRKVISVALFVLATLCAVLLLKKRGLWAAMAFALMWAEYYSQIVAGSFQFFWCYLVLSAATIGILLTEKKNESLLPFLFFGIGSLINFLDLLTFPLATLTVPLIAVLFGKSKARDILKTGLSCSISWGVGYALTWISKWVLCRVFLGEGIVSDVKQSAGFRLFGDANYLIDRKVVLTANLEHPYILHHVWLVLGVLALSVIAYLILSKKGEKLRYLYLLGMVPVLLFPYIWYEVFCNHSMIHNFFTYRAQMGTSFGLYGIIFLLWKGIYERICERKKA